MDTHTSVCIQHKYLPTYLATYLPSVYMLRCLLIHMFMVRTPGARPVCPPPFLEGGLGGITTLLRAHPEQHLQNIHFTRYLQYFRDIGTSFLVSNSTSRLCARKCCRALQSGKQVPLTKFAQRSARKSCFYCSASNIFPKAIDLSQGFRTFPSTAFHPESALSLHFRTLPVSAMPPNAGHVPGILTLFMPRQNCLDGSSLFYTPNSPI